MRNTLKYFITLCLLSGFAVGKKVEHSIYVLDENNIPLKNVVVELSNWYFGTIILTGLTDKNGKLKVELQEGSYNIVLSHLNFNQHQEKISIKKSCNYSEYQLEQCKEYCTIEGKFIIDNNEFNCFSNKMFLGRPSIYFHGITIPYEFDTLGNYKVQLPPGIYKVVFSAERKTCTKILNFIDNKKINWDFNFDKIYDIKYLSGFLIYDTKIYGSVLKGLHKLAGIQLAE